MQDYNYQVALWNEFIAKGKGRLFLAEYKGDVIGGLYLSFIWKKVCSNAYGYPF